MFQVVGKNKYKATKNYQLKLDELRKKYPGKSTDDLERDPASRDEILRLKVRSAAVVAMADRSKGSLAVFSHENNTF